MWCPRCHTDVAAEIAENGQSLLCTSCGTEIQRFYTPSLHPKTRSARDLLERWSQSDLLDSPVGDEAPAPVNEDRLPLPSVAPPDVIPTPPIPAPLVAAAPEEPPPSSESPNSTRRAKPDRTSPKPRITWRVDAAHNVTQPAAAPPVPPRKPHFSAMNGEPEAVVTPTAPSATISASEPPSITPIASLVGESPSRESVPNPIAQSASMNAPPSPRSEASGVSPASLEPVKAIVRGPHDLRLDPPHTGLSGPHFDLQTFLQQDSRKPGRSETVWGQVLAYLGVGLITIGTTVVLWSWFGAAPQYAPTGWLVCTVGQMLLFLGVITLISGGMQQTSHEVTRRVEYLGDRMLRFEQSAEEVLRGPHFPTAATKTREPQPTRTENETA